MTSAYLETKDLNFYYGDTRVLHNLNLKFKKGAITGLIGPSGSGKSTLLRTFNRIYELYPFQQVEGEILLSGQNILAKGIDINGLRRKVGMVFQKPTPFPMSIFDNIAYALKVHESLSKSQLQDRVESALHQAALWDEVKDKLHTAGTHLSGGQQQRLCIARTIAIQPDVLLLDEPTSALDPISGAKVEQLISSLKGKFTIIMVTHKLKQAQLLSDDCFMLKDGHLIEMGPTDKFFAKPKHAETKAYLTDH